MVLSFQPTNLGVALMKTCQAQSPSSSRQRNTPPSPILVDDLIVEILSWLPVKSLLQFRCVCKWWKSVISDPNFVKLHLHRSSRKTNLLLVWLKYSHNVEDVYLSIIPCSVRSLLRNTSTIDEDYCYRLNGIFDYKVVGSCNGLVCFLGGSYQDSFRCFYLRNPSTKLRSKRLAGLHVKSYHRFAFGYDNLSDTYKVLAFTDGKTCSLEESQNFGVKICSFGENCWRNIHSFPVVPYPALHFPGRNDGVYFNSALNWLASCNINSDDYRWNDTITIAQLVIVSLDLGMETYSQLLLPRLDEAPQPQVEPTIGVLMDCLCFFHDSKRTHFVVWRMREFGVEKSWTQFMKVSYQDLQIDCMKHPCPLLPLCMSENGDVLIMATVGEFQAILYHRRDNRVERTELPKYICWRKTVDYVESLVSSCCD